LSAVQHRGGMCCWGSVRDNLKALRRQEWHMRWQHFSLAVSLTRVLLFLQFTHTVVLERSQNGRRWRGASVTGDRH
jgi:hypothetical protein